MKVSYNWLQTFFVEGALPPIAELEQKLIFHAYEIEGVEQVGDDYVLDIDVLPNRASDSLSHRGIAREIATLFELKLTKDPLQSVPKLEPLSEKITLEVDDTKACPMHTLALIEGVQVGPSPQWLKERLEAIGQRSINNVVDATNYIMYEIGQPSHVFDYDKLKEQGGTRGIHVRAAHEGETLSLLGGQEVSLTKDMQVLADARSDAALDIAGVKGGTLAELDEHTQNIIVTAAKFDPTRTRKTAQTLKIRTDASSRYENETPDPLAAIGMQEVVALITSIAGGTVEGYQSIEQPYRVNLPVTLSVMGLVKHLGVDISMEEVMHILERLGFTYVKEDEDVLLVTAPFERLDIQISEDVMEEVGRVYGYNTITPVPLPSLGKQPPILQTYALAQRIRKTLGALGYRELMLYSLRHEGEVALANALNTQKDHMRENLKDGLVEALEHNERIMPLLGEYEAVKVFEVGNIFKKEGEYLHAAIAVRALGSKKQAARTAAELTTVKEALEQALEVTLPNPDGEVLEFSLSDLAQESDIDVYDTVGALIDGMQYSPVSAYPFMIRDIALWMPESTSEDEIVEVIKSHGGDLVQRIDNFDTFTKDGRISRAYHVVFQSTEKTLTDDELGVIMEQIEAELGSKEGFEVR
jgi:phenylalanyl-tRNA synthetase beta chain